MKPANKGCTGFSTNTLKLILKSASIFLSQKPPAVEASQSRRCLTRRVSLGVATPPRKSPRNSEFESESEPDSPRVSCVGQIEIGSGKRRKKKRTEKVKRKKIAADEEEEEDREMQRLMWEKNERKMRRRRTMEIQQYATEDGAQGSSSGIETAPYLKQMKRFSSGRGSLSRFECN